MGAAIVSAFLVGLGEQLDHPPGPSGMRFAEARTALLVSVITETTPDRVAPERRTGRRRGGEGGKHGCAACNEEVRPTCVAPR